MAIAQTIKRLVGISSDTVEFTDYRCRDCGHTFQSAKSVERAMCTECLSADVEPAA